jgi:replicative DNA helicase
MNQVHNPTYERSILASLILDNNRDTQAEIFDALAPEDFCDIRHQCIFTACKNMYQENNPIDLAIVCDAIEGKFTNAVMYCSEVAEALPASDIEYYASEIRDLAKARKAQALLTKTLKNLETKEKISLTLDQLHKDILSLDARGRSRFYTPNQMLDENIEILKSMNDGGDDQLITTGVREIDDLVSLRGGKLVVVAARPSVGKSAFMISIARNMLMYGKSVAIFSMEMDRQDIMNRFISQAGDINLMQLTYGTGPSGDAWKRIIEAGGKISKWDLKVDDDAGLEIPEIKRRIRLAVKDGAQVVFLDQLSQIRGQGKEYDKNTATVQELTALKKELRIPIFLLAQINRKQDESSSKKPQMYMLKTTGALEEEADVVFLLDRPYLSTKDPAQKDLAYIDIAKNRNGAPGEIEMEWIGSRAWFKQKMS